MGSGGSYLLLPPDKLVEKLESNTILRYLIPVFRNWKATLLVAVANNSHNTGILNIFLYSSVTGQTHTLAI